MDHSDLDNICRHCKRPVWKHCSVSECLYTFHWCEPMTRHRYDFFWEEHGDEFGNCPKCGKPVFEHIEFGPIIVNTTGRKYKPKPRFINIEMPKRYLECDEVPIRPFALP